MPLVVVASLFLLLFVCDDGGGLCVCKLALWLSVFVRVCVY